MKNRREPQSAHRRNFLKLAGLGAGAALGTRAHAAAGAVAPASEAAKPAGYRESEHVSTYYKMAQF